MSSSSLDAVPAQRWRPPALVLNDGAVELLKWIALFLMTLDHINKYLWHDASRVLFDLGRVVMPTFGVVLGYNLARPGAAAFRRVAIRLATYGALSSVPFILLGGLGWGWWPLNVLVTLLAATVICGLLDAGGALRIGAAALVFLIAGTSVEFWWPGIAICVCAWSYGRRPGWICLGIGLASLAALFIINANFWALGSVPLVWWATRIRVQVPRVRSFFYKYYPVHLMVIFVCARFAASVGAT